MSAQVKYKFSEFEEDLDRVNKESTARHASIVTKLAMEHAAKMAVLESKCDSMQLDTGPSPHFPSEPLYVVLTGGLALYFGIFENCER